MAEWYNDWEARGQALIENGLPCNIVGVEFMPGDVDPRLGRLLAIMLEASEDHLLRPHVTRGFPLHISLGFEARLKKEHIDAWQRLDTWLRGSHHVFYVHRITSGGTAELSYHDLVVRSAEFAILKETGDYMSTRPAHVSM